MNQIKVMKRVKVAVIALSAAITTILVPNIIRASNNANSVTASSQISYTMKEAKEEYEDQSGKVRGVVLYQYPQLKGNSDAIEKINRTIKKQSIQSMKSETAQNLKNYTESAMKSKGFYSEKEQYYWRTSCKISYNKNNLISFHMIEEWYAGGVVNKSDYGLNYNVKTGNKLTISQVILGDAKKKIALAAKKYCSPDTRAFTIIMNTKDYKFYLCNKKVYLCFESYELEHGTSQDVFTVSGNYE